MSNPERGAAGRCIAQMLLAAAFVVSAASGSARDFPQPITMGDPFSVAGSAGLLPGGGADVGFHHYTFLQGPHDLFSLRQRAAFALFATDTIAMAVHYHNFLLIGPIRPGEAPFSIAEWNMNSIQFEYGVTLGVRTPRDLRIAFEYARTSQHPFRTGYSEVSLDILELALYPEPVRLGSAWRGDIDLAIRLAHIDLYDFWESPLKAPRTRFRIEVPVGGSWDLGAGRGTLVARAWPRILFMRQRRAWPYANVDPLVQAEIDAEIGVRLARQSGIELLLEFFATGDTEQVSGEPAPLTTLGLVARLTM